MTTYTSGKQCSNLGTYAARPGSTHDSGSRTAAAAHMRTDLTAEEGRRNFQPGRGVKRTVLSDSSRQTSCRVHLTTPPKHKKGGADFRKACHGTKRCVTSCRVKLQPMMRVGLSWNRNESRQESCHRWRPSGRVVGAG